MEDERPSRLAELAYIALILAVAVLVWREAGTLAPAPYDPLGPKTFPIWVSYALGALGVAMLVQVLLGRALGGSTVSTVSGLDGADAEHERKPWVAAATLVLAFGYATALSFRQVGFLPATAVYLFLAAAVLGPLERRRLMIAALFAAVAAVALDQLFRVVFKLDLT